MRPAVTLLFAAIVLSTSLAFAQAPKSEHKLTLRAIMAELQGEFLRLTNALLIDDFDVLQEAAAAIQDHPMPDDVVAAIRNKLGKRFQGFERIDEQSHMAADNLSKRAAAKDISGSSEAFGRLAGACVKCHKRYRSTLRPLSD